MQVTCPSLQQIAPSAEVLTLRDRFLHCTCRILGFDSDGVRPAGMILGDGIDYSMKFRSVLFPFNRIPLVPQPACVAMQQRSVRMNGHHPRVRLMNMGFGASNSSMQMHSTSCGGGFSLGVSWLNGSQTAVAIDGVGPIDVPVARLADFLTSRYAFGSRRRNRLT